MLSGIGPKQQLDALAIPPLLHSPVGQNLQDHVRVPITLKSRTIPSLSEANGTLSNFLRYLRSSDGGLHSSKFTVVAHVYCCWSHAIITHTLVTQAPSPLSVSRAPPSTAAVRC